MNLTLGLWYMQIGPHKGGMWRFSRYAARLFLI